MRRAVLFVALMVLCAWGATTAGAAPGDVRLYDSSSVARSEPPKVKLVYAGNRFVLTKLAPWRGWNSPRATSSIGDSSLNGDAAIDGRRTHARISLSKLDSCSAVPVYTKLVIRPTNFYFEIDGQRRSKLALRLTCDGDIRRW